MIAATAASAPVMTLAPLDFLVVGVALASLGLIAYLAGRKEKDTRDFFLGGRSVPPFVATLSFVAAEISALTVIGVPAVAYSENWHYLQFFVGSAAGRIFVAFLFIPVFYKHNCTTVFEFLRHRFGAETEYAGSAFFFITRLLGAGVRLYAACLGISLIMGWSLAQAILVFTAVSIALIAFGGIKAVVWTGAFEACVFFLAGALVGSWLLLHIDGGLAEVWRVAGASGRLSVFDFRLDLGDADDVLGRDGERVLREPGRLRGRPGTRPAAAHRSDAALLAEGARLDHPRRPAAAVLLSFARHAALRLLPAARPAGARQARRNPRLLRDAHAAGRAQRTGAGRDRHDQH